VSLSVHDDRGAGLNHCEDVLGSMMGGGMMMVMISRTRRGRAGLRILVSPGLRRTACSLPGGGRPSRGRSAEEEPPRATNAEAPDAGGHHTQPGGQAGRLGLAHHPQTKIFDARLASSLPPTTHPPLQDPLHSEHHHLPS
jgi:hypothetical protein